MPYDLGDPVTLAFPVYDASGVLANAVPAPTCVVSYYDAAGVLQTASPAVTNPSTGKYQAVFTPLVVGLHKVSWLATGTNAQAYQDVFDVQAFRAFISVDEVRAHLRAGGIASKPSDLEQMRFLAQVACRAVETVLNRTVMRRAFTETHDAGTPLIVLNQYPVRSITSVTDGYGNVLATSRYQLSATGTLLSTAGLFVRPGAGYQPTLTVVYEAGMNEVPLVLKKVALNGVQRMWQFSQQAPHAYLDSDGDSFVSTGVLTPLELESFYSYRIPAIA